MLMRSMKRFLWVAAFLVASLSLWSFGNFFPPEDPIGKHLCSMADHGEKHSLRVMSVFNSLHPGTYLPYPRVLRGVLL
jgi:hypothetical protein